MTILSLETSTNCGSLALLQEGELLHECHFPADRSLGAELFPLLQSALDTALVGALNKATPIDQIVVGLGPGSYSGVRIAISAAMGLSLSTGAELVGISSLTAMPTEAAAYVVIGDARRNSFYFTLVRDRECKEGPLLLSPEELQDRLSGLSGLGGLSGSEKSPGSLPIFASAAMEQFPQAEIAIPSAAILARLAWQDKGIIATGDLEPIYLRDAHITLPKPVQMPASA